MGFNCCGLMSLASMLLVGIIKEDTGVNFYVAPDGKDSWSGQLPKPNAAGDDGPFTTLDRARQAVKKLKQVWTDKDKK